MPRTAISTFSDRGTFISYLTSPRQRPPSMPPTALRSALPQALSRPLDSGGIRGVFYCPSCAIWRRTLSTRRSSSHRTSGSSSSSNTALGARRKAAADINPGIRRSQHFTTASTASVNVPPRLRELHAALNRVGDVATDRVDLSRLQLALRGLESEEPLVRVAGEFLCLFFLFLITPS